jgi:hypothetical protein
MVSLLMSRAPPSSLTTQKHDTIVPDLDTRSPGATSTLSLAACGLPVVGGHETSISYVNMLSICKK